MTESDYVPPPDDWERILPAPAGFDPGGLAAAVAFAVAHETPWPHDLQSYIESGAFEPPPDNAILGPIAPRGPTNGLVLRHGRIAASWGNTRHVDQTFSVAKSYLGLLAGLAWSDGLIPHLDTPVGNLVQDGGFEPPGNDRVTWRQFLQQTSEWQGTLFGKSDWIDRGRNLAGPSKDLKAARDRPMHDPGTYWEYNDVRVNRLALALLRRFGRPLPEIFAERIMRPIGASSEWHWEGYETSWVMVDGKSVQSVSGGSHWGGGVFTHAEDQARVGLLMSRRGKWGGRQLVAEEWIDLSRTPCPLNLQYGFLWWLNTGCSYAPSAPADSYFAVGAGGNVIWVDPGSDIVAVARWLDPASLDGFIGRVLSSLV